MTQLKGARVWVTGASRGIGEAIAIACANEGARLVVSARSEDALQSVAAACGPETEVVAVDLSDAAALAAAAARVLAEGPVDVMVHNAGLTQRSLVKDTELAVHRRIMELNYFAPVAVDRLVLPPMISRGQGHLVYVSSVMGHFSAPLRSAYAASKHALQGYAETVRAELHDEGLRVTVVCPGFVATDISQHALSGDGSAHGKQDNAQSAGLSPQKVADAIVGAVRNERAELVIGGKEVAGVYIKRLSPGLVRRLIRRVTVT